MAPHGEGRRPLARATARLALFALGVALVTSRVGLLAHELVGHGGAATATGARVREVHLYLTAGGWISYDRDGPWTWPAALTVQLAGIAIELALAAAAAIAARRARGPLAVALGGAALGLALHAGFYLAAGTYHGVGDGALLHRALGGARPWLAAPVGVALVALAFVGARRLATTVRAWLPARSTAGQVAALAVALAVAGGGHAALAATELALRPSPTYQAIMKPARERAIDRDLARWAEAEAARGRPPTPPAVAAQRRALAADRSELPFGWVLGVALALATGLGAARGHPRPAPADADGPRDRHRLPARAAWIAVTAAAVAALCVSAVDALAP